MIRDSVDAQGTVFLSAAETQVRLPGQAADQGEEAADDEDDDASSGDEGTTRSTSPLE